MGKVMSGILAIACACGVFYFGNRWMNAGQSVNCMGMKNCQEHALRDHGKNESRTLAVICGLASLFFFNAAIKQDGT